MTRRHFGNVRKLPSGRYQASYWHDGQRHIASDTYATKADASVWLSMADADICRGGWVDPAAGRITVAQLSTLWQASNPRKRKSSLARDEAIVRLHVLPKLGSRAVTAVTRADVQALADSWSVDHAASTVLRQYATLRAMFTFAQDSDRIVRNPCARIRLPHVGETSRPDLDVDLLERLATELGPDQATMMWLAAVLGLRWAEAAALTVRSLDMLAHRISIDYQLNRDGTLAAPKSDAGRRRLACPSWLIDELATVMARRGLTAVDCEAFVFVAPDGGSLRYTNWRRRVWTPACERSGQATLRFHDLRSLAATALISAGVDVKTAQRRLGHASARVTLDLYARGTASADKRAAESATQIIRPLRAASLST